jgi:hypothetical protein
LIGFSRVKNTSYLEQKFEPAMTAFGTNFTIMLIARMSALGQFLPIG